jgi:hypothetical protein
MRNGARAVSNSRDAANVPRSTRKDVSHDQNQQQVNMQMRPAQMDAATRRSRERGVFILESWNSVIRRQGVCVVRSSDKQPIYRE